MTIQGTMSELEAVQQRLCGWLERLDEVLTNVGALPALREWVRQAGETLDQPLLIVLTGEFNSGKSALINALYGQRVLAEGVTPTTTQITILQYAGEPATWPVGEGIVERTLDWPLLRDVRLVDTPGTNVLDHRHEALTEQFLPRGDLILFITSAERPLTESERVALAEVHAWGKPLAIVVNKIDLLANESEIEQVCAAVRDKVRVALDQVPPLFPLSARLALWAREADTTDQERVLSASGRLAPLETYLQHWLDRAGRSWLKLQASAGTARRVAAMALEEIEDQQQAIAATSVAGRYLTEMLSKTTAELRYRWGGIDRIFEGLIQRSDRFLSEAARPAGLRTLLRPGRWQRDFEQQVVADAVTAATLEVRQIARWYAERQRRIWQEMQERLPPSLTASTTTVPSGDQRGGQSAGPVSAREGSRDAVVVERLLAAAQEVLVAQHPAHAAPAAAQGLRRGVLQATGIAAAALVAGGAAVVLATAPVLDAAALVGALVALSWGLAILPRWRRQVQRRLTRQFEDLRAQLIEVVSEAVEREEASVAERAQHALTLAAGQSRAQRERLDRMATALTEVDRELATLVARLQAMDMPGATPPTGPVPSPYEAPLAEGTQQATTDEHTASGSPPAPLDATAHDPTHRY